MKNANEDVSGLSYFVVVTMYLNVKHQASIGRIL